jgi:hypothetical protein
MTIETPRKRCEPTSYASASAARRERTDEVLTDDGGVTFYSVNAAYGRLWRSRNMRQFYKEKGQTR